MRASLKSSLTETRSGLEMPFSGASVAVDSCVHCDCCPHGCLPFAVDKRPNKDTGAHDQHLISASMSKVDGVHNICCCYGGVGSWAVSEWLVYHFLAIVVARLILVLRVVRLFFSCVSLYTHIYLGAFFSSSGAN